MNQNSNKSADLANKNSTSRSSKQQLQKNEKKSVVSHKSSASKKSITKSNMHTKEEIEVVFANKKSPFQQLYNSKSSSPEKGVDKNNLAGKGSATNKQVKSPQTADYQQQMQQQYQIKR